MLIIFSSLKDFLHNHINAEICAGTISTKQDAIDFLTWTYFFRRLEQVPFASSLMFSSFLNFSESYVLWLA